MQYVIVELDVCVGVCGCSFLLFFSSFFFLGGGGVGWRC